MTSLTKTRMLVESAIFVALGFMLSYIQLFQLPMGGSVTLVSMLPILLVGLRHGPAWGFSAGLVFSLLQFIQKPYILTPVQVLLDYFLAFSALGLSGFFKGKKYGFQLSAVIGIGARFLCSFISGVVFYGIYAADYGFASAYLYSLVYNGSYLSVELVLTLIIGTMLIKIPRLKLLD